MKLFVSVATSVMMLVSITIAFADSPNQDALGRSYFSLYLLVAIATVMIMLRIIQNLYRNPYTAGPAMVPGGVNDKTAILQFKINSICPVVITPDDDIEVKNAVEGILYGLVRNKFAGNSSCLVVLTGYEGFRAMVRCNDESWSEKYMINCGNEIKPSGVKYIPGFTFRFVENSQ